MAFFEPRVSADTASFWEGCKSRELRFQKCTACGKLRWPASYLCPDCLSEAYETEAVEKEGKIYSYIVFEKPFHPSLKEKVPYITALVDLSCGLRIHANIPYGERERVRCGAKVKIGFSEDDVHSPVATIED